MSTDITNNMELCEKLWNECEPTIRKLCNYKLSSYQSEVDDVVGEVYLALCDAVKNGCEIKNPKAWLFSTASNCIKIKYTELNSRKKKHIQLDSVEHQLFYDIDFENLIINDDVLELVKESIYNELLPSEKTLLILIYTKKLKLKEIANILNTTEPAIKQSHYRLKRKVKQLIKEKLKEI